MVNNTMHIIQFIQINRTNSKENKKGKRRGEREKKGENTMNANKNHPFLD